MSDSLPAEIRALYPWTGRYLQTEAGRLHYLDVGKGPTVLMIHGNPTWSFYYRHLVAELSTDHRCIVPDHIGCGLSDKPADFSYKISDHVENLVHLIDALELDDITLVVHDWGGAIGYAAALRHLGRVKRFVVLNTAAFLLPLPKALLALRLPLYGPVVIRGLNGFFHMGFRWGTGHKERFQGAVKQGYLHPYRTWADRRAILRFIQEIPIEEHHPTRGLLAGLEEGLPKLTHHPHLVFWGIKDPVFHPGYLEKWKEVVPEAEVHEYTDCGHWVLEEAHERIIPALRDFLARHPLNEESA